MLSTKTTDGRNVKSMLKHFSKRQISGLQPTSTSVFDLLYILILQQATHHAVNLCFYYERFLASGWHII